MAPELHPIEHRPAGGGAHGLRIGGTVIPWWALGLGAAGVGVIGFLVYRNMRAGSSSGTQAQQAAGTTPSAGAEASPVTSAAEVVPVPYPTNSTSTGTTATQSSGLGTVTLGPAPGKPNQGIWGQDVAAYASPTTSGQKPTPIPFGTYQVEGPVTNSGLYPIIGPGGSTMYALAENVSTYNPSSVSLASTQAA